MGHSYIDDRIVELREQAAAADTYGQWWRLEEELEEEIAWIRRELRETGRDVRRWRDKLRRNEERGYSRWEWLERELARAEALRAVQRAYRDELVAGLRELQRQQREHLKAMKEFSERFRKERSQV